MPLKPALHIHPKSILFATDLSHESESALRHAVAVARHYGATLHLAHVVNSMGFILADPEALGLADEAAVRDLDALEKRLCTDGALAGIKHDAVVRRGDVWPQLEALIDEDEVDMVVIGTHGRRGIGRFVLGSIAEEIFRCAECPVVTVGPAFNPHGGLGTVRQPRPVLFATDFKPASLSALPYAVTFAQERQVKLVMLHVIPLLPMPPHGHWDSADDLMERRRVAEDNAIARLHALLGEYPHAEVECVAKCGEPAEEILKLANDLQADAIAMGLHRTDHVQAASHLRTTIAYEVVCRAHCAVFTARD
jgi:nucleotide-binding universal stress UspA family protein